MAHFGAGQHAVALKWFSRVADTPGAPLRAKALFQRAKAHRAMGRLPAAESDLSIAANLLSAQQGDGAVVARELASVRAEQRARDQALCSRMLGTESDAVARDFFSG